MGRLEQSTLSELYELQASFQQELLAKMSRGETKTPLLAKGEQHLPKDDVEWFKYHCLAMLEEMGEVMQSDKRWKTHRNERYERSEKLDELADVFITGFNMAIFSGFTAEELAEVIKCKIEKNTSRLAERRQQNEKE